MDDSQQPIQPQVQQPLAQPVDTTQSVPTPQSQSPVPPTSQPVQQPPVPQHGTQEEKPLDGTQEHRPMQDLIDQVEKDLLGHIYTNLKENKLTGVAAQQLAQEFLALLPFKDKKDLVDKLSSLGQKYPEARQTYVNLGIPVEEQQRQERLDQMRAHIQAGDIDKALEVAKGGSPNGSGS